MNEPPTVTGADRESYGVPASDFASQEQGGRSREVHSELGVPRRRPYGLLPLAVGVPEAVPHRAKSVDDRRHPAKDLLEDIIGVLLQREVHFLGYEPVGVVSEFGKNRTLNRRHRVTGTADFREQAENRFQ